jgi:4-hydroxybenzoyl-CoA thioesterase
MAYEINLPVRFDDVDAAGVVYYPRILDKCHQAFEAMFSDCGQTPYHELFLQRKIGFPSRSLEVEFLAPVEYSGSITLRVSTTKVSSRSVCFIFEGRQENRTCFRAEIGKVCCRPQVDGQFEPVEIPDDIREMLNGLGAAT